MFKKCATECPSMPFWGNQQPFPYDTLLITERFFFAFPCSADDSTLRGPYCGLFLIISFSQLSRQLISNISFLFREIATSPSLETP